jgi:large subunit ribosomal protein L26e
VQVGVDPSKVVITKLKLDKDRRNLLSRKKGASKEGHFTGQELATMENID